MNPKLLSIVLVLLVAEMAYAFDVSAYWDPVSTVRGVSHWPNIFWFARHSETPGDTFRGLGNCVTEHDQFPSNADVAMWLSNVRAANQDALQWWEEMGVTKLCVEYENEDFSELAGHDLQIINNYYPAFGHWYSDAFARSVQVANNSPSQFWFNADRRGDSVEVVELDGVVETNDEDISVFKITPTASAGDTICSIRDNGGSIIGFGPWNGWWDRGAPLDSGYMAMHFKFRADIELTPGDSNTHVATLYWYFKDWTENWVRFPGIKIRTTDSEPLNPVFDEIEKSIYPRPDSTLWADTPEIYTDTNFVVVLPDLVTPVDTLEDGFRIIGTPTGHGATTAAFAITYSGHHTLYLHEVEAWDEGHHRLFRSADTTSWRNYVRDEFFEEWSQDPARHAGWYYDEYEASNQGSDEQVKNFVNLNKLLQDSGLPSIWMNGHPYWPDGPRDDLFRELNEQNAFINCQMEEFYPFGSARIAPTQYDQGILKQLWTDSSSDVSYVSATELDSVLHPPPGSGFTCDKKVYEGSRSLQAGLDHELFGAWPIYMLSGVDTCPADRGWGSEALTYQSKWVHDHGSKFWALVQGGPDGLAEPSNCCPLRIPTQNEIKLNLWLAVACDVDGIMFYSGLSAPRSDSASGFWGGLLDWGTGSAQVDYSLDFCRPHSVFRTDRYFGAKEALHDIQEIAPTLEALEFGGTTASRVFDVDYDHWTFPDSLRLNEIDDPWYENEHWFSPCVTKISTYYEDSAGWHQDEREYAQVSVWRDPTVAGTDVWFLVVNRRAMEAETRKVRVDLGLIQEGTYLVEHYIAGTVTEATPDTSSTQYAANNQSFEVALAPGEAEFIHFFLADTSDLVISDIDTLYAPGYYNRNIVLDGATVTILPDTAFQRYQVIKNDEWENQWRDSLVMLFAPGKGIKLGGNSQLPNSVLIQGNDSTQIVLKCSKGGDARWLGIVSQRPGPSDEIDLRYTTLVAADYGVQRISAQVNDTSAQVNDTIDHCTFRDCGVGIFTSGRRQVIIDSSDFVSNDISVAAFRGSIVRASNSTILSPEILGIYASNNCTIDLENVTETGSPYGKANGGMKSVTSSVWMKCSEFSGNNGVGFEAVGGSVFLADVDTTANERFGANRFTNNTDRELVFDGPISAWLSNGYNQIYDTVYDDKTPVWVAFDRLTDSTLLWNNNYWNGLATDSAITSHLRNTNFAERGVPDCTPALVDSPATCYLPGNSSFDPTCMNEGVAQELVPNLVSASTIYKNTLETNQSSCPKVPVVTRLLTVNHLGGVADSATYNYLATLSDTTTDSETRHAVNLGLALMESEAFGNSTGAATIFQQVIDSAGDDIYRKIDGQVGLLLTNMRDAERDTVDGLTYEELTWYLDSLDQILGQRFVWSQYEITDSVVMYAPVRVDSVINVRGDGVLTILPHPGYRNPVVEFADKGAIKVWGTDTTKAKGKLYVNGQPDSRITLHWEDSTGTKNIYSERGFVKVKHARLYGNGFVNQSQDAQGYLSGLRRATFQADSCSFSWFDEGVMARATDTTSYMRACTLAYMGCSAQYSGFGAGLILLRADGFLVEDCVFDGNDGVGIYHALATNVVIRNSQIINGAKVGVFGASSGGGDCRIECTLIASNGDTLPELRTYGVVYDLVGGNNSFSDSSGSLVYATDPSYVDLEEGENNFELLGSGRYLQSGDTNDVWDVTWNTWYPLTPEDSGFYNSLWPTTTTKWTIDSSLASFVSCDMAGTSAMGGDSWLIVGDDPVAGTMSTETGDGTAAFSSSEQLPSAKSPASNNATDVTKAGSAKKDISKARQGAKAERVAAHHRELAAVRALKKLSAIDRRSLAIALVKEGRIQEFEPVALGAIARGAVWHDPANTSSKFLLDYGSRGKDRSRRDFAKRLGYQALAQEGHPADAIAGLEELMRNTGSARDSILALMDAMAIYYEHHNGQALQPLNSQIVVDDPYDLVRRTLFLSELLESGGVSTKDANSAIPTSYALHQNYPNPFNPNTEIRFDLPEAIHAELKVFNILGQEVVTLVDDVRAAGAYRVLWDGKNAAGLTVASGVYIYQIKTPNFTDAKKMMLIR